MAAAFVSFDGRLKANTMQQHSIIRLLLMLSYLYLFLIKIFEKLFIVAKAHQTGRIRISYYF